MSKQEWFPLKKSQRKFVSQLLEYVENEEIFDNKDSFDILSYENVPGVEHHSSKMGVRYSLKPESFKEDLRDILDKGYYTEEEKQSLGIIREQCRRKDYPFQNFLYDPSKKLKKK